MPLTLCGYFIDNYQIQIFGVGIFQWISLQKPEKHKSGSREGVAQMGYAGAGFLSRTAFRGRGEYKVQNGQA